MRTIQITYARLTSTPAVSFNPQTGQGAITATYVVGEVIPEQTHGDGSITAAQYKDHPTCTNVGTVEIDLGPADVATAKFQEMVVQIAAQEGLDLQAGDQVLTS